MVSIDFTSVPVSTHDFQRMLCFAKTIYQLKQHIKYAQLLAAALPEVSKIQPEFPSVLMGFDFHLTDSGPRLIEVNNNAAGLYSWKTHQWLQQPDIPELGGTLVNRLQHMFPAGWKHIAILDTAIEDQFFYYEMDAYARILRDVGKQVWLISPDAMELNDGGFLCVGGIKIDGIYNRHTDFYLDTQEMAHIRQAYLSGNVGLSPHPKSYALMADKIRMVDWHRKGFLESVGLAEGDMEMIRQVVPEIKKLSDFSAEEIWKVRKRYVFKPGTSHGGKGVLIGKSVRRKRFEQMLDQPESIVVQEYVPAPAYELNQDFFKYDIRLYMSGNELIGLAARLFQGNVTNFRHPDSGFYPVRIEKDE